MFRISIETVVLGFRGGEKDVIFEFPVSYTKGFTHRSIGSCFEFEDDSISNNLSPTFDKYKLVLRNFIADKDLMTIALSPK